MKSMNGLIALVGSGEYLSVMDETDRFLLAGCGANGRTPRVVCLPTAAGREGESSWGNWNRMGEDHFRLLGAEGIGLPVIDRASADDPDFAGQLESADLIYFSGGDPRYLYETLRGSRVWQAVQNAWQRGAVLAGCSAGAMILASEIPNFRQASLTSLPAFGLLPARLILPHFDRWRFLQAAMLATLPRRLGEDEYALGIDEQTALIGRRGQPEWVVHGRQTVTKLTRDDTTVYRSGESVPMKGWQQ